MLSIEDQRALERLERLEPPDIDEILPYEDWWYALEDVCFDEMIYEGMCLNGQVNGLQTNDI